MILYEIIKMVIYFEKLYLLESHFLTRISKWKHVGLILKDSLKRVYAMSLVS